jgi:hypothetical protein
MAKDVRNLGLDMSPRNTQEQNSELHPLVEYYTDTNRTHEETMDTCLL